MKRVLFIASLFGILSPAGCSGSKTGNPAQATGLLSHFEGSQCKSKTAAGQPSPDHTSQALVTASDYDGLQCIEWERGSSGGDLTVRLLNFAGGCSIALDGTAARRTDGSLELAMVNTTCQVARCGSCLYDARYDLSGVAATPALSLHIGYFNCPTMVGTRWEYETALPLGDAQAGIICRYAPLDQVLSSTICSGLNLLCGSGACNETCADGLNCTAIDGVNGHRCLKSCATDADCLPAGTMTCIDGMCRLAKTW